MTFDPNKKRPRRCLASCARAVLPCGSDPNPKGCAAYPMHSTGNNHFCGSWDKADSIKHSSDNRRHRLDAEAATSNREFSTRMNSREGSMPWTLVIITVVAAQITAHISNRGGVSTTTSFLEFADKQKCDAAAAAIGVTDQNMPAGGPVAAIYRVSLTCVQTR
jgi:hypothetical protein